MDSPFQSLLHTNAVPPDADFDRIRTLLQQSRKQVENLDQKIDETKRLLDDLTRERDGITKNIDAHYALVSPARRLPHDIIREIFIACMPSTRNAVMSSEEAPFLLCQICSAWRQLARSTPQLWASLHIVVPSTSKIKLLVQTVASWLSRSGILPLSVSLVISSSYSMSRALDIDHDLAELLSLLADMASRWQRIRMIPPTFSSLRPLAHLSGADFPLLESASVGTSTMFGADLSAEPSPWQSLPLLTAPNLRRVSISSGYDFAHLWVPWTQLTHLRMSGTSYTWPRPFNIQDAITALQNCPELRTCELFLAATPDPVLPLTPVSLPHLWYFSLIDYMDDLEADKLFQRLRLPSLRSLKYCVPHMTFSLARHIFLPSIQRLSLNISTLKTSDLVEALHLLPLLADLELIREPTLAPEPGSDIGSPDPDFLTRLIPDTSTPPVCPDLRRLQLSQFQALSDETLLAFIRARTSPEAGPVARLERIVVRLIRAKTFDIAAALQDVVANGLSLSLQYSPLPSYHDYSPWVDAEEEEPNFVV